MLQIQYCGKVSGKPSFLYVVLEKWEFLQLCLQLSSNFFNSSPGFLLLEGRVTQSTCLDCKIIIFNLESSLNVGIG